MEASLPRVAELLKQLSNERTLERQRIFLRQLGSLWYHQNGEPEVLAQLGLALADQFAIDSGVALAELLMAYGAAREEKRTSEWENNLVKRMAELSGLHRVISAANSTLDLDTSMQMVVETVAEVIGVEVCSVYLYDKNSDDLTLRATRGLNNAAIGQIRIAMGDGVTGAAAKEGRPISVDDVRREARFRREPMLDEEPFRSFLAVPILLFAAERFHVGADKLQGVITIQTFGPRDFTPEEINFVETVAGGLAFFIVNAELYQQTGDQLHQKVQELTTLQQVSKRIAEQLDLKEVLKMIVAKTVELARVDRADVFRVGEDDRLELAATRGGGQSNGVLSFIAQAVREGRPLAVLNAYSDSRFPDLAQVAANEGFHSLFCMPLKVQQNRIIGGICLYTSEARHFDYEQVRLLSTFADEAAIAIENARLYEVALRSATTKFASLDDPYTVTYVAISEALGVAQTAEHISAIGDFSVATLPANLSNLIPPDLERAIANLETVAQTVRTYLATTSLIKQHALLLQVNEELETIERVADRLSGRLGLLLRRVVFRWHQILDVVKLLIWTGWAWSPTHTL